MGASYRPRVWFSSWNSDFSLQERGKSLRLEAFGYMIVAANPDQFADPTSVCIVPLQCNSKSIAFAVSDLMNLWSMFGLALSARLKKRFSGSQADLYVNRGERSRRASIDGEDREHPHRGSRSGEVHRPCAFAAVANHGAIMARRWCETNRAKSTIRLSAVYRRLNTD